MLNTPGKLFDVVLLPTAHQDTFVATLVGHRAFFFGCIEHFAMWNSFKWLCPYVGAPRMVYYWFLRKARPKLGVWFTLAKQRHSHIPEVPCLRYPFCTPHPAKKIRPTWCFVLLCFEDRMDQNAEGLLAIFARDHKHVTPSLYLTIFGASGFRG